jgi:site-specific DNA-adenine methylase
MKAKGVTTIVPNFGSNRMLAHQVGVELAGCQWVGIPFAGGMSELRYIDARTLNVNDRHDHLINLARVMQDPKLGPLLYRRVRRYAFHPLALLDAQAASIRHAARATGYPADSNRLDWAVAYFVVAWMTRHGAALTDAEFSAGISTRWNAAGGDSNKHYRSAIDGLQAWRKILQRANFTSLDWREFAMKCKDAPQHGVYLDPPWPDDGARYFHKFTEADHRSLAAFFAGFRQTRVVIRFGDHPLIRELYPEPGWTWTGLDGRTQTNAAKSEVLIINGPSNAKQG